MAKRLAERCKAFDAQGKRCKRGKGERGLCWQHGKPEAHSASGRTDTLRLYGR